ncbi:MAG TPA: hypothetical protein VKZ99_08130 [Gammaproteobacteria bacterium]|nr:hypothetical protein [Gammaproteobacteria bacterium]
MRTNVFRLIALALMLALAACGGGGGGGKKGDGGGGGGGGGNNPDVTPDPFTFSPAVIVNADPDTLYSASAVVSGFEGELTARIVDINGSAEFWLLHTGGQQVDQHPIKATEMIVVQGRLPLDAQAGAKVTVAVGEGSAAQSATFELKFTPEAPIEDTIAPEVAITFPTPMSIVTEEAITLTGTWKDNSGSIDRLVLAHNGQQPSALPPHVIFEDGTWQINVNLLSGDNTFTVHAVDAAGLSSNAAEIMVHRDSTLFSTPKSAAIVPGNSSRMYVLNEVDGRTDILEVDTTDGSVVKPIASTAHTGKRFVGRMLPHNNGAELLVLEVDEEDNARLVSVNVANGSITGIVGGMTQAITIERKGGGTVYVLGKLADKADRNFAILEVDIDAASVTEFSRPDSQSSFQVGGGPAWSMPADIAYDSERELLYVIDSAAVYTVTNKALFSVNSKRDRVVYSVTSLVRPHHAVAITVDPIANTAYIVNSETFSNGGITYDHAVLACPLPSTGGSPSTACSSIRDNDNAAGHINLKSPSAILVNNGELRILDEDLPHGIVSLDLASNRSGKFIPEPVEPSGLGVGPALPRAYSFLIDPQRDRLLVDVERKVRSVKLDSGDRSSDLFQADSSGVFGIMHLHDDALFFNTSKDGKTHVGRVELAHLDESNEGAVELYEIVVPEQNGYGTGVFVDDTHIYTAIYQSEDENKAIKAFPRQGGNPTSIKNDLPGSGMSFFFRHADGSLTHADRESVHVFSLNKPIKEVFSFTDGVTARSYAHDAKTRRLYAFLMYPDGKGELVFLDLTNIDNPQLEVIAESTEGVEVEIAHLEALAFDPARNRLYSFNDASNELVAINVMEVAIDLDGDGSFDKDQNGEYIRMPIAQAVVISRTEGTGL